MRVAVPTPNAAVGWLCSCCELFSLEPIPVATRSESFLVVKPARDLELVL